MLEIAIYGESVLREPCALVTDFNDELKALAADMIETMYGAHGIGLAANQVRHGLRFFVYDTDYASADDETEPRPRNPQVVVNPEITWESAEDEPYAEGCLSVPGVEAEVFRPSSIKLRYQDENGTNHERTLTGLEARCAQHEIDHLDGKLFVDRLPLIKRRFLAGKLNALKKEKAATA